jgi:poly(3-hydroxyalkanoate) synthetase
LFPEGRVPEGFKDRLIDTMSQKWGQFFSGIFKYENYSRKYKDFYSYERKCQFWENKSAKVYCYKDDLPFNPKGVALFIPSLMNSPSLFHIPVKNFAKEIQKVSFIPVFFDWGEEGHKNNYDFSGYVEEILMPAYMAVHNRFGLPIYLIGHYIGAIAACALSVLLRNEQKKLARPAGSILLAMPWDFGCYPRSERKFLSKIAQIHVEQSLHRQSRCSWLLQILLNGFYPEKIFKDFCWFDKEIKNKEAEYFVQVWDWLNDTRLLSDKFLMQCLGDWFRDNNLVKKKLYVCGQTIDPKLIKHPVLVVNPLNDKIVPYASIRKFVRKLREVVCLFPNIGFLEFFAGEGAQADPVSPCVDWIKKHGG